MLSTYNNLVLILTIFWLNWWACFMSPRDSRVSGSSRSFRMASGTHTWRTERRGAAITARNVWATPQNSTPTTISVFLLGPSYQTCSHQLCIMVTSVFFLKCACLYICKIYKYIGRIKTWKLKIKHYCTKSTILPRIQKTSAKMEGMSSRSSWEKGKRER